ncbi:hypothetical protein KEM52_002719 [Ascosphaera acerosa]|nr:hypothetical protein KEM52_002719 [Ascosphaera acerosa]
MILRFWRPEKAFFYWDMISQPSQTELPRVSFFFCCRCRTRFSCLQTFWQHLEEQKKCAAVLQPGREFDNLRGQIRQYCLLMRIVRAVNQTPQIQGFVDYNGYLTVDVASWWMALRLPDTFDFDSDVPLFFRVALHCPILHKIRFWYRNLMLRHYGFIPGCSVANGSPTHVKPSA